MTDREKRHQDWIARIADYQASGLTMAAWCSANHCTKEQLKYWLRKMKETSPSASPSKSKSFIPLSVEDSPISSTSIIIHVGQARIELQADFDPQLLRKVIGALEAPC